MGVSSESSVWAVALLGDVEVVVRDSVAAAGAAEGADLLLYISRHGSLDAEEEKRWFER